MGLTQSSSTPTLTARDIAPDTKTLDPEAPELGGYDDNRKNSGKESLTIGLDSAAKNKKDTGSGTYSSRSTLFIGGQE